MRITSLDLSVITAAVRRHEAIERFARYMLIYNGVLFLVAAAPQLARVRAWPDLAALLTSDGWLFAGFVLATVVASYFTLAHRWAWVYALLLLAQIVQFAQPSPDKHIFVFSVTLPYVIATNPAAFPLLPLATELAVMTATFAYVMAILILYSLAWVARSPWVPAAAYGPRQAFLRPLRLSTLLDTRLAGQRSLPLAWSEALLFALSSLLFVAASMAFFYGVRRVQNAFGDFASRFTSTCAPGGVREETLGQAVACIAGHYPWSRAGLDLGLPLLAVAVMLVAANLVRRTGRRRFLARLARRPVAPEGATLFLRAFRDDQVRMRRANRNLFSAVFDLGRAPATLDEIMLERLEGAGDLVAIGNPQDRRGEARASPWGAHRLYVDDADWQATAARLARAAERIVLCVDASEGVRWEIALVLASGHTPKTLFVFNPDLDGETRRRLLVEEFDLAEASLAGIDPSRIVALKLAPDGSAVFFTARRPERDAYLVAARLAFAPMPPVGRRQPGAFANCGPPG
jgi:hypothetical protein